MHDRIKIQLRNVYGTDKAYPVCSSGECLAAIAGTKTLTRHTLQYALAMGFTIEVVDRYGTVCRSFDPRSGILNNLPATIE